MSFTLASGITNIVVVEHRERRLHPHLQVFDGDKRIANISVPTGGYLQVRDGDEVKEGDILSNPKKAVKAVISLVVFQGLQSF